VIAVEPAAQRPLDRIGVREEDEEVEATPQRRMGDERAPRGLSIFDVQEQGGWKKLDMVRRYTKRRPIGELRRMPTRLAGMLKRRAS
jgi:hypothetical protein